MKDNPENLFYKFVDKMQGQKDMPVQIIWLK